MENIGKLESEFLDRHGEGMESVLCAQCEVGVECYRKEMALCAYLNRPGELESMGYREFLELRHKNISPEPHC